jgi:hypothetical protein
VIHISDGNRTNERRIVAPSLEQENVFILRQLFFFGGDSFAAAT